MTGTAGQHRTGRKTVIVSSSDARKKRYTMASIKTQVRNWDFLPVMLSQEYLAGLMGITIPEVTRYCRLGKIPGAKKVGKYWFVEKSVLRNYMEG